LAIAETSHDMSCRGGLNNGQSSSPQADWGGTLTITKIPSPNMNWGGLNNGQDHSLLGVTTLCLFCKVLHVIFLSKILLVMQGVETFRNFILDGEESFVQVVSEVICLSYEVKIVQIIFYSKFLIQTFLLVI
jgi:hypothetical protein